MYAIIAASGKQYKVSEGMSILIDKIEKNPGEEVVLDNVVFVKKDKESLFGAPTIKDAKVLADVIKQTRGPRIIVFKRRAKKGYKKMMGHRQYLTELKIKKIVV